jgi:hypothetical protein
MHLDTRGKILFILDTRAHGPLAAFRLRMSDIQEVKNRLGTKLEEASSAQYAETLASVICYPAETAIEGKYRPEGYAFSSSSDLHLSDGERENFSATYIEPNQ